ncbi:MAG: TraB/GumN family protein [Candidatus Woesearchaeota archaeon]
MTSVNNVHFIGTSHIARESVKNIKEFIETEKPDIVAVELDFQRLKTLLEKRQDRISIKNIGLVKEIGITGFVFAYIASMVQKRIGKAVNTQAGSDMLTAVKLAKKNNLQVALIDQDVNITLKKISKEMKFKEKMRILWDIIRGVFTKNSDAKELGIENMDLNKVPAPEIVEKLLKKTKNRYPTFHKVLVEDRNKYMIKKLLMLSQKFSEKKILAVVGAGHKKEMEDLLSIKLSKINSGKADYVFSHSIDI